MPKDFGITSNNPIRHSQPAHLCGKADGTEIIYLYNADGQRVFKKVDDTDGEHYIMDGSVNVGVFAENGSLTHWNMLADGVAGRVKVMVARSII